MTTEVEDRLEIARRQRRGLEVQLLRETDRRFAVEAELRRVEGLLRATLDLIEPEHVKVVAENGQLRAALEPFAARGRAMNANSPDVPDVEYVSPGLTVGDFRRAAALTE